jgi:hypothetical protein
MQPWQRLDDRTEDRIMRTSIATVCLSGGLSEKLQAIAAAGFHGVEIFENDLLSYHGTPTDVAKEIADLGLTLITFQPFRDFEGVPNAQRLPVERLGIIKVSNILYDRDDVGEYFQLYTRSFKDLFFIEVVERRGYRGFGPINASIRLHAQSRLAADLETSRL